MSDVLFHLYVSPLSLRLCLFFGSCVRVLLVFLLVCVISMLRDYSSDCVQVHNRSLFKAVLPRQPCVVIY